MIEFNRFREKSIQRETDLRVQGLRIFLIASALAGTRAKNKRDPVGSLRETDLCAQSLRKYF